jgi:hypothetical protein
MLDDMESIAQEALDGLYKDGVFVKALDESGEPLLHNGRPVFKLAERATASERAFWRRENNLN